ncbi:MAG: hypothetical protein DCC71_25510, partial [Proteobacteria bacterium]
AADAARGPFVGRDDALGQLRAAWNDAASGRGGIAIVCGPPGIGKTRLAEVFSAELQRAGARVLTGRAREGEGVPALWIWAEVMRRLAATPGGDEAAALTAGSALLDPDAAQDGGARTPQHSRFLLFDGVARALVAASRTRPVVVVLEDLQWAGGESLRLLEHLAFEVAEAALLIVASVRTEAAPPPAALERTLAALRQQPRCTEVTLRGFSRREVAQLLERTIGRPPPPDLTSELVARTEGVPLLLREALRLLAERGDLRQPEGVRRWAVSLPARAFDLIRRPLERLSAPCADLLAAGAVLGREWPLALAAAVAGAERASALDLLDEAQAAGVVEQAEATAHWRFSHALFQEAVYAALPAGRRARLHARAADELERRHAGEPLRVVAELAHHRHQSLAVGDPERAYACAVAAAARAAQLFAFEQAATHHAQALDAIDHATPVDAERRLATLLALGEALGHAGDRERRRRVFTEAWESAIALGRPVDAALAAIGFCDIAEWAPEDDEALARLHQALDTLPAAPDTDDERAHLLTRVAYLSARRDPAHAERVAREAVALARRCGDAGVRQDAIYALHFLLAGPDHLDERDALGREIVEVARSAEVRDATHITLLDVACDRLLLGDAEGARRQRALADEIAGSVPNPRQRWHALVYDGGVAALEGRLADAERLGAEAGALGARIQHPYARGVQRALRAIVARVRGDEAEVLRIFDPRLPIRIGPTQWVQAFAARALVALGRREEARALFDDLAKDGFRAIPRNIRWCNTVVETANLCADLGDAERAGELAALLRPVAHHHAVLPMAISYGGPAARALARLAELRGLADEAAAHFEEAIDAAAALEARPAQAQALV